MDQYTFPHSDIQTDDGSGATVTDIQIDPLHTPCFFGFAPKGEIGVPVYGSGVTLSSTFSSDIYKTTTALGNCHQMQYFRGCSTAQRVWFVRLPDGSSVMGFSVIVLARTLTVPAYAKDATTGAFQTTTANGVTSYTVENDSSGNPKTQSATAYSVVTTPLVLDADSGDLVPDDATIRKAYAIADTDNWYEIVRITGKTPGPYVTRSAIALSVTPSSVASDIEARINMPLVRITPTFASDVNFDFLAQQSGAKSFTYGSTSSFTGQSYTDIVINAKTVIDPQTTEDLGWVQALSSAYPNSSSTAALDYDIFVNTDGGLTATGVAKTGIMGVLALAMRMGTESGRYTNGQMAPNWSDPSAVQRFLAAIQEINVLNGQDLAGNNLLNVPLDTNQIAGAQPFGAYSQYNGFDGTALSSIVTYNDANLDTALQTWLGSSGSNNFNNVLRYNISHVYDSGFSAATKDLLAAIQGRRDGTAVDLACADFSTPPASQTNSILGSTKPTRTGMTEAASLSMLATLLTQAQLYPDSTTYDTPAFRCEIFPQSGTVSVDGADVVLPTGYARMLGRAKYYNTPSVTGTPKGRPNSEVTMFSSFDWMPNTADEMQAFWSKAGNYVAMADRSTPYFPDLRTVYSDETSLFSDGVYKDYICFTKQLIHRRWTYYSGLNLPALKITGSLADAITTDCATAMGSYMPTKTTVSVNDSNTATGYTLQANTDCYGYMPGRVLESVITALRADTGTTTSSSASSTSAST